MPKAVSPVRMAFHHAIRVAIFAFLFSLSVIFVVKAVIMVLTGGSNIGTNLFEHLAIILAGSIIACVVSFVFQLVVPEQYSKSAIKNSNHHEVSSERGESRPADTH